MTQLFVATRKGLIVYRGTGTQWVTESRHFLGEPITAVLVDPTGRRWLAAQRMGHFGVKLKNSDDAGATWRDIAVPQYPPKPQSQAGDADDANPWTLDQIWILEGFHPAKPERIWAGTIPGGLFRSDDGGATWNLIESLWQMPERRQWFGGGFDGPGIHSICVHPDDPDDVVVGVSCGGCWRTRDGGLSWSVGWGMTASYMPPERQQDAVTQDPHRVVQAASNPQILWTQHHCGIFKSVDRGANWTEVTTAIPSNFGFAVAVDPHDADRAWFAPAQADTHRVAADGQVVVSHTRDGGATFEIFRDGLPQQDAYDLVYRHALDIDASGAHLAMASTTGTLWLSADGGRCWQTVNSHLPPVYALRFVG